MASQQNMVTSDMSWPRFVSSQKPSGIPNSAADLEYYDFTSQAHTSNEKNPGWLGYIGNYILPRRYIYIYIRIISQAIKFWDPVIKQPVWLMESVTVVGFFRGSQRGTSQVATKVLQIPETLWPLLPSFGGGSGWKSSCKGDLHIIHMHINI